MLYYRAVIKFLSSRSKWRFTRNISRKYYTCFVTFSCSIWPSLTSSLLGDNWCYGQLNNSSNSVPLLPFITYWDSDLSKEWEIDNKKLRHIMVKLNRVQFGPNSYAWFQNRTSAHRAFWIEITSMIYHITTRNREIYNNVTVNHIMANVSLFDMTKFFVVSSLFINIITFAQSK